MKKPVDIINRFLFWWEGVDSNHRSRLAADLQSGPFDPSGTFPYIFQEIGASSRN